MTKKRSVMTPEEYERCSQLSKACRERNRAAINARQRSARAAEAMAREAATVKLTPEQIAQQRHDRAKAKATYKREWALKNADHVKAKRRQKYAVTRESAIAAAVDWNRKNTDKRKAIAKRYSDANPAVRKALKANRRALESASGGKASKSDVQFLERQQRLKCAVCRACLKAGYELDHITPLAAGGRTERTNLQLLCMPCNRSKGAKNPTEFMQQRGFLL